MALLIEKLSYALFFLYSLLKSMRGPVPALVCLTPCRSWCPTPPFEQDAHQERSRAALEAKLLDFYDSAYSQFRDDVKRAYQEGERFKDRSTVSSGASVRTKCSGRLSFAHDGMKGRWPCS